MSKKEIEDRNNIANKIKSSNLNFGDNRNDYATTNKETFRHDNLNLASSINMLSKDIINDIKGSHFKLGYLNEQPQSTHQSSYVLLKNLPKIDRTENVNKKDNINLKSSNRFDGKSIYMNDYTIKK